MNEAFFGYLKWKKKKNDPKWSTSERFGKSWITKVETKKQPEKDKVRMWTLVGCTILVGVNDDGEEEDPDESGRW